MIVEQIMKKDVITLTKTDTLETAIHKLKEFHIRHLPVINEDRHVIGMITDRDMKQASPSIFEESKRSRFLTRSVESIMKKTPCAPIRLILLKKYQQFSTSTASAAFQSCSITS